jgi:hypothetical protein
MAAEPSVHRAWLEDLEAVRKPVRAAVKKYLPLIGCEPKPMRADHARAIREVIVWVLEDTRALTAALELKPREDHRLIEKVAARPDRQERELGRCLLDLAGNEARTVNLTELRAYTNERHTSNIARDQHLGYSETHRQPLTESTPLIAFTRQKLGVKP